MGIYVPFLKKMPSRCEFCPLIDGTGCRARNPYYLDETGITRPKNCPLVELPPHGRLIDADALIAIENRTRTYYPESGDESLIRHYILDYITLEQVKNTPTILEAEVEGENNG